MWIQHRSVFHVTTPYHHVQPSFKIHLKEYLVQKIISTNLSSIYIHHTWIYNCLGCAHPTNEHCSPATLGHPQRSGCGRCQSSYRKCARWLPGSREIPMVSFLCHGLLLWLMGIPLKNVIRIQSHHPNNQLFKNCEKLAGNSSQHSMGWRVFS